ncbi:hypothetical protein ASPZODRAFT_63398 [Penicilliopsis zonata CBS 506.65]|uniref:Tyrosine specific protein phosphatases domain-containing protein n=1 Tax=Penicilliopsis zonata CBS 506.65 TaxID=1073090 RepID=A0A1L9SK32_9EURO|nr:hypothetical protein ASPZODRAFT_63398 [Penicilliopsis zonata CBS 506.65]OJJ47453.1 hypothetical protein ASPZODRAFT_63398 [Penicilliopsis zonata CBS 506.65]
MGRRHSARGSAPTTTTTTIRQTSIDLDSAERPFDNIINFRDVGSSINQIHGSRLLKEGVLFRSARLDDASERDKRRLIDELHISTVIDLRSRTEHQMAAKKTQERLKAGDANAHLLDLPGVQRHSISLTGRAFEKSLLWRLDWFNFFKVLSLVASGYRTDAIHLIAQQVMQPRGLIGLGQDTLDCSGSEIKKIFDILSAETDEKLDGDEKKSVDGGGGGGSGSDAYPILLHCTQGKDRTGLIVLLVLFLVGDIVPATAISDDYVRSEQELSVEFDERIVEIRAIGLSDEYAMCPPSFTQEIKAYLDEKYGGIAPYLASIGVDAGQQEKIKRRLLP